MRFPRVLRRASSQQGERQPRRRTCVIVAAAATLIATVVVVPPAAAHDPAPRTPPQAKTGNCVGALPIVVASDAGAQSDMYSAVTLAGALGTKCIILAGARGGAFPAAEFECLKAAASGGYVVGGTSAVPNSKLAGRAMTRIAGNDRWATAEKVGQEVQRVLGTLSAAARQRNAGTPAPGGGRGCGSSSAGTALSASQILAMVGPSIPMVESCLSVGSGILIGGGYVLTGYQVVGLCETVTITFPDGTRHADVPVAARIFFDEYALLGPIRTTKKALALENGEQLPSGSRLYRIGHDYGGNHQPSIDGGRLVDVRTSNDNSLTLLETDAALSGHFSGDALVDDRGRVVGIFTSTRDSTDFGLAVSTVRHAEDIPFWTEHDPVDDGWRTFVHNGTKTWHFDLPAGLSAMTFFIDSNESQNGDIDVRLRNCPGGSVWVADWVEAFNEPDDRGADFVASGLPTFARVSRTGSGSASCTLTSNVHLHEYSGGWHGQELDLNYDELLFVVELIHSYVDAGLVAVRLSRGDTLRATADSHTADTYLTVYDDVGDIVAEDDDSGPPNIFGNSLNAEIIYRVPASGVYFIEVSHWLDSSVAGASSWRLTLERTR